MVDISGEEWRKMRAAEGYSVTEFAKLVGVSHAYVSLVEHGHRRVTENVYKKFISVYRKSKEAI